MLLSLDFSAALVKLIDIAVSNDNLFFVEKLKCVKIVLFCAETRSFWISWEGGVVAVGKEQIPYEHQLLLFSPMDEFSYPIEAISVRTVGGDGIWTIDKMAGE